LKTTKSMRDEVRRLDREATGGEWVIPRRRMDPTQWFVDSPTQLICNTLHGNDETNARLIATYRSAAPDLADDVDTLRAAVRELRAALKWQRNRTRAVAVAESIDRLLASTAALDEGDTNG
jgi:hypothetical protein